MRLQIFSDAHIDYPGARGLPPLVPGARAVIVAGDTCEGLIGAVSVLRRKYPPSSEIVVVAGNHEFFGATWSEELRAGKMVASRLGIHLLENEIERELAKSHDGPTLVLTHHAPCLEAIAPFRQAEIVSAAYGSDLLRIIDHYQPDLWISGHTHWPMNVKRGRTRLISNPIGYGNENLLFDPLFCTEIDA